MNIYIIAGPPGVGKSTSGYRFVPADVPIIDQDLAAYQYRKVTQNDIPGWLYANDIKALIL